MSMVDRKRWPPAAHAMARLLLREHADDLFREAERVADRAGADAVFPRCVEEAAHIVRICRTSSGVADVLLSVGTAVVGIGGGALVAAAADGGAPAAGWVAWTSVVMLITGSVMSAIGGTAKWLNR